MTTYAKSDSYGHCRMIISRFGFEVLWANAACSSHTQEFIYIINLHCPLIIKREMDL